MYWLTESAWLADLQRTVYPHKWSPVSCRSSAGQGKFDVMALCHATNLDPPPTESCTADDIVVRRSYRWFVSGALCVRYVTMLNATALGLRCSLSLYHSATVHRDRVIRVVSCTTSTSQEPARNSSLTASNLRVRASSALLLRWREFWPQFNPLESRGNYSATSNNMKNEIDTLAVDGWAVLFCTARRGLDGLIGPGFRTQWCT